MEQARLLRHMFAQCGVPQQDIAKLYYQQPAALQATLTGPKQLALMAPEDDDAPDAVADRSPMQEKAKRGAAVEAENKAKQIALAERPGFEVKNKRWVPDWQDEVEEVEEATNPHKQPKVVSSTFPPGTRVTVDFDDTPYAGTVKSAGYGACLNRGLLFTVHFDDGDKKSDIKEHEMTHVVGSAGPSQ